MRRRAGYLLAIALTLGLSALAWTLAIAPVHGVHSAAACDTAYAEARSRTDSIAVDLLSYPDPTGHGLPRRCGFPRE